MASVIVVVSVALAALAALYPWVISSPTLAVNAVRLPPPLTVPPREGASLPGRARRSGVSASYFDRRSIFAVRGGSSVDDEEESTIDLDPENEGFAAAQHPPLTPPRISRTERSQSESLAREDYQSMISKFEEQLRKVREEIEAEAASEMEDISRSIIERRRRMAQRRRAAGLGAQQFRGSRGTAPGGPGTAAGTGLAHDARSPEAAHIPEQIEGENRPFEGTGTSAAASGRAAERSEEGAVLEAAGMEPSETSETDDAGWMFEEGEGGEEMGGGAESAAMDEGEDEDISAELSQLEADLDKFDCNASVSESETEVAGETAGERIDIFQDELPDDRELAYEEAIKAEWADDEAADEEEAEKEVEEEEEEEVQMLFGLKAEAEAREETAKYAALSTAEIGRGAVTEVTGSGTGPSKNLEENGDAFLMGDTDESTEDVVERLGETVAMFARGVARRATAVPVPSERGPPSARMQKEGDKVKSELAAALEEGEEGGVTDEEESTAEKEEEEVKGIKKKKGKKKKAKAVVAKKERAEGLVESKGAGTTKKRHRKGSQKAKKARGEARIERPRLKKIRIDNTMTADRVRAAAEGDDSSQKHRQLFKRPVAKPVTLRRRVIYGLIMTATMFLVQAFLHWLVRVGEDIAGAAAAAASGAAADALTA